MSKETELTAMVERELETLEIYLWGASMRCTVSLQEYITASIAQGVSKEVIKASLLNDLETGGRIFGEFRNAVRATGTGSLNRFSDVAQFNDRGVNTQDYRWVAVLSNTCPDCEARHGQVKTFAEWEVAGLPRAGQTVCKGYCKCVLSDPKTTEMVKPIKREKRSK